MELTPRVEQGTGGALDSVVSCGRFADPTLRTLIELWKYKQALCISESLERVLMRGAAGAKEQGAPWAGEGRILVIPMPSDERTVLERGFQHTEPLARILYRRLFFWGTYINVLRRKRSVLKQARISDRTARNANVQGAYVYADGVPDIAGVACVLVDDVYTSGASMQEAARVLKEHGARRVYGFVLARG